MTIRIDVTIFPETFNNSETLPILMADLENNMLESFREKVAEAIDEHNQQK